MQMPSLGLQNLKVSTKLFLGSVIMIAVSAGIMGIGQYGMSRVNQEMRSMYEDRLIPVKELTKLKADLMESRAILVAMIYEPDLAKKKKMQEQLQAIAIQIDQTLARYLKTSKQDPLQNEQLRAIQKIWEAFRRTRDDEIIPAVFQGNIETAANLALGVQAGRFKQFTEDANALVERVQEKAEDGKQAAERMVSSLRKIAVALSIIGILLSAMFSLIVAKNITDPLERIVLLADDLGKGRLGTRLTIDSKDEVGRMAGALNLALEQMGRNIEEQKKLETIVMQSEKMSAIGQLASGVAHEINNPLGIILGFAQNIAKRVQPGDPLEMPVKSIEREAIRCKNLVQELLTFSRVGKTEKESLDLKETVESALTLIQAQSSVKNVTLVRELSEVSRITVNRTQIQQVIVNLCNNAIDAMPQGGRLTVCLQKSNQDGTAGAVIEIRDTGSGIPKELHKKIFDPFFTTKEIGKGTGLGLSLVYEIVQNHLGRISLESESGKGSVFRIFLPLLSNG